MINASAFANAPFDWPMNTDPKFLQKTSDPYLIELSELGPGETLKNHIPSLYATTDFDLTLVVDGDIPVGSEDEVTILSVTFNSAPNFVFSFQSQVTGTNTIRVWGDIGSFPGEYFEFLMIDRTIQQLQPYNTEPWATILEWKPPATPWTVDGFYNVTVEYELVSGGSTSTVTEHINILQHLHWNWEPSLEALQYHVVEGEF